MRWGAHVVTERAFEGNEDCLWRNRGCVVHHADREAAIGRGRLAGIFGIEMQRARRVVVLVQDVVEFMCKRRRLNGEKQTREQPKRNSA